MFHSGFLDIASTGHIMRFHREFAGKTMFLDVHELALRKTRIRKSYSPGTLDFHSAEFRQVEPLEVRATAAVRDPSIVTDARERGGRN